MKYPKRKDRYDCDLICDNFHEVEHRLMALEGGGHGPSGGDGVGILNVEQTTTSTEDDGINVVTVTLTDGTQTTFEVQNGSKGSSGKDGLDGYTPVKGVDYVDGKDGQNGKDGTSVTVKSVSESTADGDSNVVTFSDGKTVTIKNGSKGSAGVDGKDGKDGSDGATGQRGTGILKVTTAPSSYTTAIGSYTPKYRIALSTVKSQSGVSEVLIGDVIQYSYYQYLVDHLDGSYAYISKTRTSLRGAAGSDASVTEANITTALGYTPADADDVSKISVFVTPQMFGAVGDGATDDTVAMQNAFNEVATNGKYLFIPKGRYKVTAPITVDWSSTSDTRRNFLQKIIGAGSQAFESYYDNTAIIGYNIPAYRGVIELIGSGNTWGTETRIEDLSIECDKTSCDPMSFALMYGDARNFKLSRVKLKGHNDIYARCGSIVDENGNPATTTYEQINVKFEQCDFYTFPDSTRGFAFLPEAVVTRHYNTMDNISLDSCTINGVWVVMSINILFQSCHVAINNVANKEITTSNVGLLNGYELDYATGFYIAQAMSAVFQNCYFEDYRRGIHITPTIGNIRNVSIMNCYLNPGCNQFDSNNKRINADYGVRINSGQDGKVVRNVLVQNNVFRYVKEATEGPTAFVVADVSNEFANHFVFRDNCTTSTQEVPKVVNTTTSGYDIQNGADSGASVKSMTTSDDGKIVTIELTNGKSCTLNSESSAPVKGVDYFTETEIDDITENAAALAKAGLQQIAPPTWVESVDDMTDQSKNYVLLETGNIWAYMTKRKATAGETVPAFTNLMDDPNAYIKNGYRYSLSGGAFKTQTTDCAIVIPLTFIGNCTLRVRGVSMDGCAYGNTVYTGATNQTFTVESQYSRTNSFDDNGDLVVTFGTSTAQNGGHKYAVFNVASGVDASKLIVTLNEEIKYTTLPGGTEIVEEWTDTGHCIVSS